MFDIDGTLIDSNEFDNDCYLAAVKEVLGISLDTNWEKFQHLTDWGILRQTLNELCVKEEHESIISSVKERFVHRVSCHLAEHSAIPIPGAPEFLAHLADREDVMVAMATGGWFESAKLKLDAAGIDVKGIPIASASDHYSRIEIMKTAEFRTGSYPFESRTYFGDGAWDLKASKALAYNFILVGSRFEHGQTIPDFTAPGDALAYIGL